MSKNYKLEDCDILEINGHLMLVHDDGVNPRQKVLVFSNSRELFNNNAIKIFGEEEWMEFLFCLYNDFADATIAQLLNDMYDNHKDTYHTVHAKMNGYYHGDGECKCDENCEHCECCDDNDYLAMKVVRRDDNGHRWAAFDKKSIEKLEDDVLYSLAEDMDIPNPDLKTRAELIDAICAEESDIDADEYDCDDDCDGDCESCDYAELDDREDVIFVPDFHDTGKHTENGRAIYKYNRNEIEQLSCKHLVALADMLGIDVDELDTREDFVDALCDLSCLVDEKLEKRPQETKAEDANNEAATQAKASQNEAQPYESVNGPAHYNGTECIENMRKLYGDEAVRWFCICNAYKYRFRKGNKPGQSATTDENKAHWYEDYVAKMMSEQRYY